MGSLTSLLNHDREDVREGNYGLSSLSEKTRNFGLYECGLSGFNGIGTHDLPFITNYLTAYSYSGILLIKRSLISVQLYSLKEDLR